MRYTDEIIEEVRERNDIVDVISGYVKLQKRGSTYFGLCPFHNEKTASFSVTPSKQMYYCFGCGKGGNVFTFLMEYENFTFQEAVKQLADRAGIRLPEADQSKEAREAADRKALLLEINKNAAVYYYRKLRTPSGKKAMEYLTGRGLSEETITSFGLGYSDKYSSELYRYLKSKGYADELLKDAGLFSFDEKRGFSDKFWNRVMFPIMDANSRVIGFGGRVMGDGKPKYLNSPETQIFDKSRNLYGLNVARKTRRKNFIICEGYMDVISMHQAGYTNAVASLGTALTSQQCSLISRYTKEVLVIYDMDDAGVRAALRAIPMLRQAGLMAKVVDLRPCKDPDEFLKTNGAEAFEQRLEKAENSFLFMIRMLERDYDLKDPDGRTRFFHETAKRLAEIEDAIERESYTEAIARRYRIEPELLKKQIGRQALAGTGRTEIRVPKPAGAKVKMTDRSADREQRILLTWIASDPQLVSRLEKYITPEDFVHPMYREVAGMVFEMAKSGSVSPARIINHFTDAEQQTEAASLFNTEIALDSEEDRKKAIFDVVCRIRLAGINARAAAMAPSDLAGFMKIADERKQLEQLRGAGLAGFDISE